MTSRRRSGSIAPKHRGRIVIAILSACVIGSIAAAIGTTTAFESALSAHPSSLVASHIPGRWVAFTLVGVGAIVAVIIALRSGNVGRAVAIMPLALAVVTGRNAENRIFTLHVAQLRAAGYGYCRPHDIKGGLVYAHPGSCHSPQEIDR